MAIVWAALSVVAQFSGPTAVFRNLGHIAKLFHAEIVLYAS